MNVTKHCRYLAVIQQLNLHQLKYLKKMLGALILHYSKCDTKCLQTRNIKALIKLFKTYMKKNLKDASVKANTNCIFDHNIHLFINNI